MMVARILVTGSREFTAAEIMGDAINQAILELGKDAVLVHGDASGADQLADALAAGFELSVERWPAAWALHGHHAGHIRNQAMVDAGADLCLAFRVEGLPCNGTRHCASRAAMAGITVRWYVQKGS